VKNDSIEIRKCHELDELRTAVALQKEVWNFTDEELVPLRLFVVAEKVGGQVLGAFDGKEMVGFALAVPGIRGGHPYLHSHMLAVRKDHRNAGLGRRLKLMQREEALARGIELIEWTFDPLEIKNAHFNLNRLGAICRKYHPNLYGVTTSPLHRGLATDRLLAEWHLDSGRVVAAIENLVKDPVDAPAIIEMPAELDRWQREGSSQVGIVQARVREGFARWFAKGYAAVALRTAPGNRAYLLTPWSDY